LTQSKFLGTTKCISKKDSYVNIKKHKVIMTGRSVIGMLMILALMAWALTFAVLIVADKGDAKGTKYYAYATFGVAPLVTALGLWLVKCQ
jgi:hypothetical protein